MLKLSGAKPSPAPLSTTNSVQRGQTVPQTTGRVQRRRRGRQCGGARAELSSEVQPEEEEVVYKDSLSDIAFIGLCRVAYGNIAQWQSPRSWTVGPETFRGMVEVSRALMRSRTAAQQQDAVISGFPSVPPWFRRLFPYSRWGAEVNSRLTLAFFAWLVGPMETCEVELPDGQRQNSGVQIKRCRYLVESNCTAMCINLCKAPTQAFFTQELGMPLTMEPNFTDCSCKMIFGQRPPPLEEDPALQQPCLAACATAVPSGSRCHKLD